MCFFFGGGGNYNTSLVMVIKFYDYRAMIVLGYIKFMSNQSVVIKLLLQLKSYINLYHIQESE